MSYSGIFVVVAGEGIEPPSGRPFPSLISGLAAGGGNMVLELMGRRDLATPYKPALRTVSATLYQTELPSQMGLTRPPDTRP